MPITFHPDTEYIEESFPLVFFTLLFPILIHSAKIPLSLLFSGLNVPSSQPFFLQKMLQSLHHFLGPLLCSPQSFFYWRFQQPRCVSPLLSTEEWSPLLVMFFLTQSHTKMGGEGTSRVHREESGKSTCLWERNDYKIKNKIIKWIRKQQSYFLHLFLDKV